MPAVSFLGGYKMLLQLACLLPTDWPLFLHFADNSPDIYRYKSYPSLIHLPPIILLEIAHLYASVDSWTIVEVPLGQTGW